MSKAYYYCKNFSFKQVNNLFAYSIKDPSLLTRKQRITRLYKGMLRKLLAQHMFTIRRPNVDRFHDEQYRVRRDFERMLKSNDEQEVNTLLEQYELYIEKYFEPYAAMHESRQHSNLWGKMLLYGPTALATDQIGYYKPVLLHGEPSSVHFHEQYPHMVSGWVYDHKYMNEDFDYNDLEKQYLESEQKSNGSSADSLK